MSQQEPSPSDKKFTIQEIIGYQKRHYIAKFIMLFIILIIFFILMKLRVNTFISIIIVFLLTLFCYVKLIPYIYKQNR